MRVVTRLAGLLATVLLAACATMPNAAHRDTRLRGAALDDAAARWIADAHVTGLAIAVIENGRIVHERAFGWRDAERKLPLRTDTVMYAASTTKLLFAYAMMTLVDDGRLDLDRRIADVLPKPLPDYEKYADLADDPRWRRITPRMLLSHTAGFPNFRFFTPHGYDEHAKLTIELDPGTRFAYSGEGINLLQFVVENGLHVDVGALIRTRVFERFGMTRSSMTWRGDFAGNVAIGYDEAGKPLGHKQRSGVRAAGSMDTTLEDYAKFLAGLARCDGITAKSCATMRTSQIAIDSVQQFPTLDTATTRDNAPIALGYGLGAAVFKSPQGPAFFKSGHDDGTNNLALCLGASGNCVLILSNSSNGESTFAYLVDAALGTTCFPWYWEADIPYDRPTLRDAAARTASHPPCTALR